MRIRLLLLLCLLTRAWGLKAGAQPVPQGFRFERPRARTGRLPYLSQRNLLVVPVHLNGTGPYNFLLDTGVGTSLITDPALEAVLGRPRGACYVVRGAGEGPGTRAWAIDSVQVKLPGVVAPAGRFLLFAEAGFDLTAYVGMPVHGILGHDFFASFVVSQCPEREELVLYAPARYRPPRRRGWVQLPLDLEGQRPYLTLPVQLSDSLRLPLRLLLDTGAGHALSLETAADRRIQVPDRHLRTPLGYGLSGPVHGCLGRVPELLVGPYPLPQVLTSFPDDAPVHVRTAEERHGSLGAELLKHFDAVIDYPHNRLLLRPGRLFRQPFEHDMAGVELLATGPDLRRYLITRVEAGSPAEAAGLCPGDELVAVDLRLAHTFSLTQLSTLLHAADGRRLLLIVRRGEGEGELLTMQLRLRRQI
ncbi:aspartyl protease family protein [Hymenobacter sp. APR13]|uniref:aspartyl protease family protein n=1 Tax=Hymenobacter sp. APR13 TaxID=1356852 RepID=UPI0004E08872|nr:aspartyl protease family protein [Hymenobacter sp. APR13]AII54373.1 hypothetical protein N008_20595 [Hymenobacter sp. APR13]